MMDTEIIITCGATLADIIDRHFCTRPHFTKLWPGDARGEYGHYLLWADERTAETILRQYPEVARCA